MLTDSGPLVALLDSSDQHHSLCTAALRNLRPPMLVSWSVLTEASHLLRRTPTGPARLFEAVTRGLIRIVPLDESDVPRIRELMVKYTDLPMDLADATLVRIAERDGHRRIFTTDRRHFEVYRLKSPGRGREKFAIVP